MGRVVVHLRHREGEHKPPSNTERTMFILYHLYYVVLTVSSHPFRYFVCEWRPRDSDISSSD